MTCTSSPPGIIVLTSLSVELRTRMLRSDAERLAMDDCKHPRLLERSGCVRFPFMT